MRKAFQRIMHYVYTHYDFYIFASKEISLFSSGAGNSNSLRLFEISCLSVQFQLHFRKSSVWRQNPGNLQSLRN